jgi:hypothetical protein
MALDINKKVIKSSQMISRLPLSSGTLETHQILMRLIAEEDVIAFSREVLK